MAIPKSTRAALAACALALSGCYVLPVMPDGQPYAPYPYLPAANAGAGYPAPPAGGPAPTVLQVRLYPANDVATQTGVITGTVTRLPTGQGRFQISYKGETLSGEATRVDGDTRRGLASAYGGSGSYMSCDYQMHTPRQGAGTCSFSNGALYKVHIGT